MTADLPARAKCATCGHMYSFHTEGGPCTVRNCAAKCRTFTVLPDAELYPKAPTQQALIDALDALVTVIQRAPQDKRSRNAIYLEALIRDNYSLRRAAGAARRPLRDLLAACRRSANPPQDAEVAPDDAQDTPGPH